MANDLVSTVSHFLTPDMVQKIATSVGADGQQVQSAIGAAVPALLAGLAGTATHGGAQKIADAVNQQSSVLDNVGRLLGGGSGQTSLIETGTRLVGSLLGSNQQSGISSAISKFSGLGQGAATALIGALAPIVLGMIGKHAGPRDVDATTVSNLLEAQKSNIAHAMPSRLSSLLAGSGVIENLDDVADTVRGTTASAARTASSTAYNTTRAATHVVERDTGGMRWLYWLIPLLALLGLLWYFLGRPQQPVTTTTTTPATTTTTTTTTPSENVTIAPNLTIGGVNVGQEIGTQLNTLRTSLEGITDAASAQAALPRIEAVSNALDPVVSAVGQATAEQRAAISSLMSPLMQTINPLIERVMAIPGVSEVLKPAVDTLTAKLTTLAR